MVWLVVTAAVWGVATAIAGLPAWEWRFWLLHTVFVGNSAVAIWFGASRAR